MIPSMTDSQSLWRIYSPVRVVFGKDALDGIGKAVGSFGNRVLIMTTPEVFQLQPVRRALAGLQETSAGMSVFDKIISEPTVENVDEAAGLAKTQKAEVIVGIGGGSAMDAAKAAAVVAAQGGTAAEYLDGRRTISSVRLPVIAVPTTAGTGAELSRGAILTWREKNLKSGIRGDAIFPCLAIVDPALTSFLPPPAVAATGFDVFSHAVETFLSKAANPWTSLFSLEATESVCRFLPRLLRDPRDDEARVRMSFFSMLMGFNLANSTTCLPHRLQYPLGVLTHTSHASGLAALYPAWFKRISDIVPDKADCIAECMRRGLRQAGVSPSAVSGIDLLSVFMTAIGFEPRLRDLGVNEEMCAKMAAMAGGSLQNDPAWSPDLDLAALYRQSL